MVQSSTLTRHPPASDGTIIVMPAYNAANTIERIISDIPPGCFDEIIVVDDASHDGTAEIAARLPVTLIRHQRNLGYGGNQKTCYREALARGAAYVVMLHPDYQYDARIIPAALDILRLGICDVVLGNRIRTRKEALAGGMPLGKYFANRGLTFIENVLAGQNLGEWHSGFRAYQRRVLETVPYEANGDDFVFDSQFLLQAVHFGFKIGDLPAPVRYFDEASSIGFRAATRYALLTLWTFLGWYLHLFRITRSPLFLQKRLHQLGAPITKSEAANSGRDPGDGGATA
jgi:glycosyltransferase involved in cell wall biosynthesis